MRLQAAALRRETERQRHIERLQRLHLLIEPALGTGAKTVGPAQAGAQMLHPQFPQQSNPVRQAVVLEMEPLADAESRREAGEVAQRELRRAVLAHQAHIEMPVVGRSFSLAMTRRRGPRARQVEEAVPVNTVHTAGEQLRRPPQTEL